MDTDQTQLLLWRLAVVALAVVVVVLLRRERRILHFAHCLCGWLSSRPWAVYVTILVATVGIGLLLTMIHYPQPWAHDEFSYLLAGDTFSQGRLSNPVHPMWRHFETFHVLQQPSYAAKYPPGNGIALAIGQSITGHPIVGVWVSLALANMAVFWALSAWLPPKWASLGGLLVAIHAPIHLAWGQSYWGGAVAMLGGALIFGGIRRIWMVPRCLDAVFLSLGMVLLAISRPMEGLLASIPVLVALGVWLFRPSTIGWRERFVHVALPVSAIGVSGIAGILLYNSAVTRDPLMLPYRLHDQIYSASSMIIWKKAPEIPRYNHPRLAKLYVDWARKRQADLRDPAIYWPDLLRKISLLCTFFSIGFGICLPAIALRMRGHWVLFALATILAIMAIEVQISASWIYPHYLAPVAVLFYVLNFQGLRQLRVWKRTSGIGPALAQVVVVIGLLRWTTMPLEWRERCSLHPRAAVADILRSHGDQHLVIVSYDRQYTPFREWVYNRAEIDDAAVVWARDMGSDRNRNLIDYYSDRRVWYWNVSSDGQKLTARPINN